MSPLPLAPTKLKLFLGLALLLALAAPAGSVAMTDSLRTMLGMDLANMYVPCPALPCLAVSILLSRVLPPVPFIMCLVVSYGMMCDMRVMYANSLTHSPPALTHAHVCPALPCPAKQRVRRPHPH